MYFESLGCVVSVQMLFNIPEKTANLALVRRSRHKA